MSTLNAFPDLRPTLLLDFANTKQLDPRVTFSRASAGKYYDGKTTVKAEENLLRASENLENTAVWPGDVAVTPNAAIAPDGTMTAYRLTGIGGRSQTDVLPASGQCTLSVWARSVSGTGTADLFIYDGGIGVGHPVELTTTWQRFDLTIVDTSVLLALHFYLIDSRRAGVLTDIYVWHPQLEIRDSVTSYTPTTTQPITRYIPKLMTAPADVPRSQHDPMTGKSLGLLREGAATNLQKYSEALTNVTYYGAQYCTLVSAGTYGDVPFFEMSESAENNYHSVFSGESLRGLSAGIYNFSAIVRKKGRRYVGIAFGYNASNGAIVEFDLETATLVYSGFFGEVTDVASQKIEKLGDNLFRVSASFTLSALMMAGGGIGIATFSSVVSTPNIYATAFVGDPTQGVFLTQFQLEPGSKATSYIKTEASTVTRAADVMTMTGENFSSWFNPAEGTFVVSGNNFITGTTIVAAQDSDLSNYLDMAYRESGATGSLLNVVTNGVSQASLIGTGTADQRSAVSYKANDFNVSINGSAVVNDSSGVVPIVDRLVFYGPGIIESISYYPKALPLNLQALAA